MGNHFKSIEVWKKHFYLATDASKVGGGGMLYQRGSAGRIRIIGFWSKAWNVAQCKYSSPEREFLAARQAMDYFRTYLFGKQFTLVTDCSSITYTVRCQIRVALFKSRPYLRVALLAIKK
jgi:hypothetical protein